MTYSLDIFSSSLFSGSNLGGLGGIIPSIFFLGKSLMFYGASCFTVSSVFSFDFWFQFTYWSIFSFISNGMSSTLVSSLSGVEFGGLMMLYFGDGESFYRFLRRSSALLNAPRLARFFSLEILRSSWWATISFRFELWSARSFLRISSSGSPFERLESLRLVFYYCYPFVWSTIIL